jgi:hypothetical protein
LISKEDKLFLPEGDAPGIATEVVGLRLKKRRNEIIVQAKLVGPEDEIVTYRIIKDPYSKRYVIASRSGAQEDSRYQDCID